MTPTHKRLGGLALAVSIAVAAAPTAWARPAEQFLAPPPSDSPARAAREVRADDVSPQAGFGWGDAEIGAGAGAALGALAAGSALMLAGHRRARPGLPAGQPGPAARQ